MYETPSKLESADQAPQGQEQPPDHNLEGLVPKIDVGKKSERRQFMLETYEGKKISDHRIHLKGLIEDIAMRFGLPHKNPFEFAAVNKTLESAYGEYLERNGLKGFINFTELDQNHNSAYALQVIERVTKLIGNLDNLADRLLEREDLRRGTMVRVKTRTDGSPTDEEWMIDPSNPVTARGALQLMADNPHDINGDPLYKAVPIQQIERDNPKTSVPFK